MVEIALDADRRRGSEVVDNRPEIVNFVTEREVTQVQARRSVYPILEPGAEATTAVAIQLPQLFLCWATREGGLLLLELVVPSHRQRDVCGPNVESVTNLRINSGNEERALV